MGYVILVGTAVASDELREEVRQHVAVKLGPTARPKAVFLVPGPAEDPLGQDHAPLAA